MTTAPYAQIPLAIGASLMGLAARGANWGLTRMAQAPMASTGVILLTGLTLMGGANALFMQDGRHPAPMFVSAQHAAAPVVMPPPVEPVVVTPVERPAGLETAVSAPAPITAPVAPPAPVSIGNADIAEMQEKLMAMGLFDGTVDGYYGPKTADAIRAFEARFGLPRSGAATPQLIDAVRNAPVSNTQVRPAAQVVPVIQPAPVVAEPVADEVDVLLAGMEQDSQAAFFDPTSPATPQPQPVTLTQQASTVETVMTMVQGAGQQAVTSALPAALDRDLVSDIQRGLSRLGFLQAPVDGVAGESTARAIRKFQIFNNFTPTGEVSPAVLDMLVAAGAYL